MGFRDGERNSSALSGGSCYCYHTIAQSVEKQKRWATAFAERAARLVLVEINRRKSGVGQNQTCNGSPQMSACGPIQTPFKVKLSTILSLRNLRQ
jgi:hypothetical protein